MQDTEVRGDIRSDHEVSVTSIIRSGLGCFASKTLLAKALEMAISDQVTMGIMIMIMTTMM